MLTVSFVLVASVLVGCGSRKPTTQPATRPLGPPVFDGRRGGGSFPLETNVALPTNEALRAALELGYTKRLRPPTTQATAVRMNGPISDTSDRLDELTVEVTGWSVRPEYEPKQLAGETSLERTFRSSSVAYRAEPLLHERGAISVVLEADDAEMHLLKDKAGTRGLVLAGAKRGSLRFRAAMSDLSGTMFAASRRGADRGGAKVDQVQLALTSDNPRSLDGTLTLRGSWLLLPMTLHLSGRIDVDDTMHATFSRLGATGEGPAGDIIAPFIDRGMKKIDGRRSPLMVFRDGKTKATDFRVHTGEHFDLEIKFGR